MVFNHFVGCLFIGIRCFGLVLSKLDGNDSLHFLGAGLAWLLVACEVHYSCWGCSLSRAIAAVAVSRGSLGAEGSVVNLYAASVILHA